MVSSDQSIFIFIYFLQLLAFITIAFGLWFVIYVNDFVVIVERYVSVREVLSRLLRNMHSTRVCICARLSFLADARRVLGLCSYRIVSVGIW